MQLPIIDPVFLRLGPLEFRWYGLMYILGFTAAYFIIKAQARKHELVLSTEALSDIIFIMALGIVLGGRSGYIIFYNLAWYLSHPLKVFAVWEGGMSFHGGMIGGIIAAVLVFRKYSLDFWQMIDIVSLAAPLGLCFGRIGNFINGELFGRVTDRPWGIIFPGGGNLPRHPSQLYEAFLEGILLLVLVWGVNSTRPPKGVVFWTVFGGYGFFRFLVEFFREPDQQLGFLWGGATMGQVLSLPMCLLGGIMIIRSYAGNRPVRKVV